VVPFPLGRRKPRLSWDWSSGETWRFSFGGTSASECDIFAPLARIPGAAKRCGPALGPPAAYFGFVLPLQRVASNFMSHERSNFAAFAVSTAD
jgi:hypothetical protein